MLGENIKYLRTRQKLSQEKLAEILGVKRSSLSGYELGTTEPNVEILSQLSDYFEVSIDALVKHDLKGLDKEAIKNKDLSSIRSSNIRVLSTTVDKSNKENIEYVPKKAKAGYLNGYADPEFIKELPKFNLPHLPTGTYRAFELEGDSMLPMPSGSVIIGKYVEDWREMKDNRPYVLVTDTEGLVYKRIRIGSTVSKDGTLTLISDNPIYQPYTMHLREVREAWGYYAHIGFNHPDMSITFERLMLAIGDLHRDIEALKRKKLMD